MDTTRTGNAATFTLFVGDESFEVPARRISGLLLAAIGELDDKFKHITLDLFDKYPFLKAENGATPVTDEDKRKAIEADRLYADAQRTHLLTMVKLVIDQKGLEKPLASKIATELDSTFWQDQALNVLAEELRFFRGLC